MKVLVLGPIAVTTSSGDDVALPGAKLRGLLALLALDAGRTLSPERIVDALWGESATGLNALQVTVSKLRRALADAGEPDRVVTAGGGYSLRLDRADVDALQFELLTDLARDRADDPATAADALATALELWRGAPLAGAEDTDAVVAMRARLVELRRVAEEDAVEASLALGRHRFVVGDLESLVAAEPLRERRWEQLVRALYGSGRQADALRAFGRARSVLIEQVGVEPGPELRRLEVAVLAHDALALGAPSTERNDAPIGDGFRRRGNLRYPVAACIGRGVELVELQSLVAGNRLVTLTGPGGVGKTRLAMEVAVGIRDEVVDGVWWVELAPARTDADVVAAVQRSLGMDAAGSGGAAGALDSIVSVMQGQDAVLVLDNCEHVLDPVASVVTDLLGRCERLRVVATSREGLGVIAEALYVVGPLAPDDAVALFEARQSARGDAAARSGETIAKICERLDNLPLAIELAAARTRHLRVREILDRLSDRLEVLGDGTRTSPPHQRSLIEVARWSYDLLDDSERIVFERLSVFADGATVDAARHVCATATVRANEVERLLERLVDKSLVVGDASGAQRRFRLLQTLADYATERLADRGERADAMRAHALWVRDLASTVRFLATVDGEQVSIVQAEDTAVRDAIAWALDADPLLALEICSNLAAFWFGTMRVSTGWELLAAALDAAGPRDAALRASALTWAHVFATMMQDAERAEQLIAEALAIEQRSGDPVALGCVFFARALACGYRSSGDAAQWVTDARAQFDLAGTAIGLGHVSFADGALRLTRGEFDGAATGLRDAVDIFDREGDHLGSILAVSRLGELAYRLGDIELFDEMHRRLLDLGRASDSDGVVTGATARLAHAALLLDDLDAAQRLARTALSTISGSFMPIVNGYAFRSAGLVNLRSGHVEEGRTHLLAAVEAFEQGTGSIGLGQAALCWIDLSDSYRDAGDTDAALAAATSGERLAELANDPWVLDRVATHRASLGATTAVD
jgi:predicted ATPase